MIVWDHLRSSMIIWDHLWSNMCEDPGSWHKQIQRIVFLRNEEKTTWWISEFTQMNLNVHIALARKSHHHLYQRGNRRYNGGTDFTCFLNVLVLGGVQYRNMSSKYIFCTLHSKESSCSLPKSKQEIGYIRWKLNSAAFFPKFPWLYCYMTTLPHLCFLGYGIACKSSCSSGSTFGEPVMTAPGVPVDSCSQPDSSAGVLLVENKPRMCMTFKVEWDLPCSLELDTLDRLHHSIAC